MSDRFAIVVVGGGPAGLCAAIAAARAGAKVAVLERGAACGSKNVMGGILFTAPLEGLFPSLQESGAPLERPVVRRSWSILSEHSAASFSFGSARHSNPPHNHAYTVLRGPFDAWLARQAEAAGAQVFTGVVVDRLLRAGAGKVAGVLTRVEEGVDPTEGRLEADVVVLAEGANSVILEREGLRHKTIPSDVALAVKEVLALPEGAVTARFGLGEGEGEGREYYGEAVRGMFGSGFLYTNRESVSVGVAVSVKDLSASRLSPNDLIESFKSHPAIRPLIEGARTLEYSAHMIPEGGLHRMGRMTADGLLVAGDAAGLVNVSPYHEGANLAMASGIAAGTVAAEAVAARDVSSAFLERYTARLGEGFVLKDMGKFAGLPGFFKDNPQVLSRWPGVFLAMLEDLLDGSGRPKEDLERRAIDRFRSEVGILPFLVTVAAAVSAVRPSLGAGEWLSSLAKNPAVAGLVQDLPEKALSWLDKAMQPGGGPSVPPRRD